MIKLRLKKFYQGKLEKDLKNFRGPRKYKEWLVGDFKKFKGDIRKTGLLELKYWEIKRGQEKKHKTKVQKSVGEITIILDGKAKGFIDKEEVVLEKDKYFYIPPGIVNNLIKIIESEKIKGLTIKAPSIPGDEIKIIKC